MESNLNYVGLAGADGTITPISPGLKPAEGSPEFSGSIVIPSSVNNLPPEKKGKAWGVINNILGVISQGADIWTKIKTADDLRNITIVNPNTGANTNLDNYIKGQSETAGLDPNAMMLMVLQTLKSNNQNNNSNKKDNTLLYVGIGFGALILVGALAFALKK